MFPSPSQSLCSILTSFGAEERCAAGKGRARAGLERQHHKADLIASVRRPDANVSGVTSHEISKRIKLVREDIVSFFSHAFLGVGLNMTVVQS